LSGVLPYEEAVAIDRDQGVDTTEFDQYYYVDDILTGKDSTKDNDPRVIAGSSDEEDELMDDESDSNDEDSGAGSSDGA